MRIIARELPNLVNGKKVVPMVTDDEKSFEARLLKLRVLSVGIISLLE